MIKLIIIFYLYYIFLSLFLKIFFLEKRGGLLLIRWLYTISFLLVRSWLVKPFPFSFNWQHGSVPHNFEAGKCTFSPVSRYILVFYDKVYLKCYEIITIFLHYTPGKLQSWTVGIDSSLHIISLLSISSVNNDLYRIMQLYFLALEMI